MPRRTAAGGVFENLAIDMVARGDPDTIAANADSIGDAEPVFDENSLVPYPGVLSEPDGMCRDGVPVVIANQEAVVLFSQFVAIDRSGGQHSRREDPVPSDARNRFDILLAGMISWDRNPEDAHVSGPVAHDDMVVVEECHAMWLSQALR